MINEQILYKILYEYNKFLYIKSHHSINISLTVVVDICMFIFEFDGKN